MRDKVATLEAMLCATLTQLEKSNNGDIVPLLDKIDWAEAGVTRKAFATWWIGHKKADAKRRAKEQAEAAIEANRQSGLAKLTADEIKALGLNKTATPFSR